MDKLSKSNIKHFFSFFNVFLPNFKSKLITFLHNLFSFLLDLLSFGTPLAIITNFIIILSFCFFISINSLETFPIKCIFKHHILPFIFQGNCPTSGLFAGCNCLGCGMTHSVHHILHGNFNLAWNTNKLSFVVMLGMIILVFINIKKLHQEMKLK